MEQHAKLLQTRLPATTQQESRDLVRLNDELVKDFSTELAPANDVGTLVATKVIRFALGCPLSLSVYLGTVLAANETVVLTAVRIRAGSSTNLLTATDVSITAQGETMLSTSLKSIDLKENDIVKFTLTYTAGAAPTPLTSGFIRFQAG